MNKEQLLDLTSRVKLVAGVELSVIVGSQTLYAITSQVPDSVKRSVECDFLLLAAGPPAFRAVIEQIGHPMRRACPQCGHHWAWALADGRFKCRRCRHRYTFRLAWDALRLSERTKLKLLDYFVLGVPAYRLRFRGPVSRPTAEKFFRVIGHVLSVAEECAEPFAGAVECDESMFGGRRKGKRGWGAAGKVMVLGILQRDGVVRAFPIRGRGHGTIERLVVEHTRPGSL